MQPTERYDIILQMLASKEMVTIGELLETFDVSIETVRLLKTTLLIIIWQRRMGNT